MNVSIEQLLIEVGRLHVTNQVLSDQLAASRQQLVKLSADQVADGPEEPDVVPDEDNNRQ